MFVLKYLKERRDKKSTYRSAHSTHFILSGVFVTLKIGIGIACVCLQFSLAHWI